ncbi:hypothetical protein GQ600_16021 [Phytophthora cactorum]|nr:hypothetical protein GQ600_16021 [Phytophthora cactorum]
MARGMLHDQLIHCDRADTVKDTHCIHLYFIVVPFVSVFLTSFHTFGCTAWVHSKFLSRYMYVVKITACQPIAL